MRDKLISILQRWPFVHRLVKVWYWKIRGFQESFLGTRIQERYWRKRHLLKRSDWQDGEDWVMGYWNSKSHPHRQFLMEKISRYFPLRNVLEIGSNCGPNLYLLAKKSPQVKLVGIDINREAINIGKRFFTQEGISNIELLIGKADTLYQFSDKSFDLVFCDAILIYIGPDKIKEIMKEIIRVSRKAIILVEWHEDSKEDHNGLGVYHFGHWKRNYVNLLKQFVGEDQIYTTKIPEELWPGKHWQKLGYLVEVSLAH